MKCSEIQELFGVYWDLPNDDLRRAAVDKHISELVPSVRRSFKYGKKVRYSFVLQQSRANFLIMSRWFQIKL